MRKIKLKAQVKPKCNCEDHYLELFTSFDGETSVYQGYCYKCGKWWTYTKHKSAKDMASSDSLCELLASKLLTEDTPHVFYGKNNIILYDGNGCYEMWSLCNNGCIGELLFSWRN